MTSFYAILFLFNILYFEDCEGGVCMEMKLILIDIVVLACLAGLQYIVINKVSRNKIDNLEKEANDLLENSKKEVDSLRKEAILEAKEEVHRLRTDFEKESRERRNEVQRLERRLIQRETKQLIKDYKTLI